MQRKKQDVVNATFYFWKTIWFIKMPYALCRDFNNTEKISNQELRDTTANEDIQFNQWTT